MSHEEVVRYIQDGNVLQCPDHTPPQVYSLMRTCWHRKPSSRPSFKSLLKSLNAISESLSKQKPPQQSHV
ncbi:MUSK [Cordylochernes scorpioides]|uniref:MUSK n=1 Tax=Cordylochernes scorpioides TaxID=51811 RepID=A0ABY6KWP7_9ARAC|nr:MUSK [Cordylochernes scorpioides]